MTDTSLELAQQADHERRLAEDLEYAIQHKKDEIYGDLVNFQQFMEDYQMNDEIARELLRALCNVDYAQHGVDRMRHAVLDALSNIKDELDAKIANIVRSE